MCAAPQLHGQPDGESLGAQLPPRVRGLLIEEMRAILAASQTILEAIGTGRHDTVAEQATLIHDSFILEQQMTAQDRAALLDAAPAAFLEKDEAFHELSERLAEAARERNVFEQREIFADMVEACVVCHAEHAADRFPGLQQAGAASDPAAERLGE